MLSRKASPPVWRLGDSRTSTAGQDAWQEPGPSMPAHVLYLDDSGTATHYRMGGTPRVVRRGSVASFGLVSGYYRGELSNSGRR
jgi:hypothetical protein